MITSRQIELVQITFAIVSEDSKGPVKLFFEKLFKMAPELEPLFDMADMPKLRDKVMGHLASLVGGLEAPERVTPHLEALGQIIAEYDVVDNNHFDDVEVAILFTLKEFIQGFNEDERSAWETMYKFASSVVMHAMAQTRSGTKVPLEVVRKGETSPGNDDDLEFDLTANQGGRGATNIHEEATSEGEFDPDQTTEGLDEPTSAAIRAYKERLAASVEAQ